MYLSQGCDELKKIGEMRTHFHADCDSKAIMLMKNRAEGYCVSNVGNGSYIFDLYDNDENKIYTCEFLQEKQTTLKGELTCQKE